MQTRTDLDLHEVLTKYTRLIYTLQLVWCLTQRSSVHPEKLVVAEAVKITTFSATRRYITMYMDVFWVVASCNLVEVYDVSKVLAVSFIKVMSGGSMRLWNVGELSPDYKAQ